ncbi:MAG: nucleotide exchange factor GrpE [Proteobacteria bacterium]|jgi:molecular chaperone GrpE|nr:nucleotide exchange factor GrpE [Pseudomonadota bacterium]
MSNNSDSKSPETEPADEKVKADIGENVDEALEQSPDSITDDPDSLENSQPLAEENEQLVTPERVAALEHQVAELKDQYVRAHAETENIRKRAANEVTAGRKFAIEGFAKDILNVRDSLGLASSVEIAEDQSDAVAKMGEGLELTLRQLDGVLERFGVKAIDVEVGDKLDPESHQAMSMIEDGEIASGCIITVIQPGYKLHDRLLRPAMVVVAK